MKELPYTVDLEECKRVRKRILNYQWHDQIFYFKGLFVQKPEDKMGLVIQMHEDLGHFGEEKTLVKSTRGTSGIIKGCKNDYKVMLIVLDGEEGG